MLEHVLGPFMVVWSHKKSVLVDFGSCHVTQYGVTNSTLGANWDMTRPFLMAKDTGFGRISPRKGDFRDFRGEIWQHSRKIREKLSKVTKTGGLGGGVGF